MLASLRGISLDSALNLFFDRLHRRTAPWYHAIRVVVLLAGLLCTRVTEAHPFDGDGSGPAKEGSSNAQAYLYLEPFACRMECLIWLPTALEMFRMPQGEAMLLPPEVKVQIIEKARAEAAKWCAIKVNGVEQAMNLETVTVLRGRPGATDALKPDEAVGVMDAMLGLTWECGAPKTMQKVEVEWRKYTKEVPGLPVTLGYGPIFEHGMVLNAAAPVGIWKNDGRLSPARELAPVPPPPPDPTMRIPVGSVLWAVFLFGLVWWRRLLPGKTVLKWGLAVVSLVLGVLALWNAWGVQVPAPWVKREAMAPEEAQKVVQALLRNTYRAFDQRDESSVYDVLAHSIHGDLLQRIYLQTTQALALEAQDGTRVKVSDLVAEVEKVDAMPESRGFVARGEWKAFGRVGHWGHAHSRVSHYKANLTVEPVEGAWKLTGLEVLEEVRDMTARKEGEGE